MLTVKATETSPKELLPQASLPVLHDSFRLRTAFFLAALWNQQLLHLKLSIASLYGILVLSATHDFYSLSVRSDQRICIRMRTPSTSSSSGPFRRAASVQLQRCQFPPRQFFAHSRSACRANAAELPDATSRTSRTSRTFRIFRTPAAPHARKLANSSHTSQASITRSLPLQILSALRRISRPELPLSV